MVGTSAHRGASTAVTNVHEIVAVEAGLTQVDRADSREPLGMRGKLLVLSEVT